jgi:hypothetical protein
MVAADFSIAIFFHGRIAHPCPKRNKGSDGTLVDFLFRSNYTGYTRISVTAIVTGYKNERSSYYMEADYDEGGNMVRFRMSILLYRQTPV